MNATAGDEQNGDGKIAITICGQSMTMSKRTGQAAALMVIASVSALAAGIAAAIVVLVQHFAGLVLAILLVIALAAFCIPYTVRANRKLQASEAAQPAVPPSARTE